MTIDRRTFLAGLPVAAWLRWSHGAAGASDSGEVAKPPAPGPHRIRRLELATAAPLAEMKRFYGELLGLPVLEDRAEALTIAVGETPIRFVPAGERDPAPFYHFAFNIPENKILAAREWQLQRTPLEPPDERLRDPTMPPDVVDYRHWDAHSIFFWDPGGNFVEYIARHTLDNAAAGGFSTADILYASEIGLITDDTAAFAGLLRESFGLAPYHGGSEFFRAMGDERGLLIVMRRGRQMGWEDGRPIDVAPADVLIRSAVGSELQVPDAPYRVAAVR